MRRTLVVSPMLCVVLATIAAFVFISESTTFAAGNGGQIAIYREATAGDALTTANFDHDWDTTVREDSTTYTLNANGYDIECSAGHYLVQYSSRFDDPGNNGAERSEAQTHLRLAGTDLDIGWSQGFTRRQNNDFELICSGGGIIEVASDGDAVSLRSFRTDAEADTMQREPDASAIQLLRLDDSWDYCRLSKSSSVGLSATTFTDVTYDQQDELDAGSFAHSGGDITLKTAGHYLVFANTYFQFGSQSTDNRSAYEQQITVGGSLVNGTKTTVYLRGNPNSDSACDGSTAIGTIIETTSANQILNVEVRKEFSGAESPNISAGRTAVTIVKLPDDGDYIRLDDSGTDAFNPSSGGMGWDTELEIDSGGFTHSDTQVGAAVDDDYLFFTTLYDDNDGSARIKWWQRWRVNGTDTKQWSSAGRYSRNSENQANGNYSGIILAMTSGDYVEVVSEQLGNSGTMDAQEKGLQGVRIGSILVGSPIFNVGAVNVSDSSANLVGDLFAAGTDYDVSVYYSISNNADSAAWLADGTALSASAGSYTNENVSVTGAVSSLSGGTTYYFTMVASNATSTNWATPNGTFDTVTAESDPPVIASLSPANGESDVLMDGNLVASFDEAIYLISGGVITITNLTDATGTNITLPNIQVSAAGTNVTINPSSNLDPADTYAVLIDNAAVEDIFNNVFTGINSTAEWQFVTDKPPGISSLDPVDDETEVSPDAILVATFDETVSLVDDGVITITNLTDGTATEITLPDSQVTIESDTELTINLDAHLDTMDTYAVLMSTNVVEDSAGNRFAGISDTGTWQFTTTTNRNWSLVAYWPLNDGTDGQTVTTADDVIDDPSHPATDATESGAAVSTWAYDAELDKIVFRTYDDSRLVAGTMGIEAGVDLTWQAWIKSVGNNTTVFLGTRSGTYLRFNPHKVDGGWGVSWNFSPDANDDVWHHMVLRRANGTWNVFIDGVQASGSDYENGANNSTFEIGGSGRYSADFDGYMSDAAIWKEALSATRIAQLAAGGNVQLDNTAPVLQSLSPTNGATGVAVGDNLVMTFDDTIVTNAGDVVISNVTDSTTVVITVPGTDPDGTVLASGNALTINPAVNLDPSDDYAILVDASVAQNGAGDNIPGITDDTAWRFTTGVPDVIDPTLSSVSPTNNTPVVPVADALVATFSENVTLVNGGTITVSNLTDGTATTMTIPDAQLSVAGADLTINLSSDLEYGDLFAVTISADAMDDSAANSYAGILDTTTWRFTTDTPPVISSLSPVDDATEVGTRDNFVVTFNENVVLPDSGVFTVTNLTQGTSEVITSPDDRVTVAGSAVTINPTSDLRPGEEYAIQISADAVEDVNGHAFAGISDVVTWNFTATIDANANLVAYWPMTNDTVGAIAAGAVIDDLIDDPTYPETDGVVNNSGGSWVNDAERGIVWHTAGNDRALAGSTQMGGDFTWSVWAKSIAANTGPTMGTRDGTYTRFYLTTLSGGYLTLDFPDYNDDAWHHFVLRRFGNVFTVHVDGSQVASKTQAAAANTMKMELGGHTKYAKYFDGYMHETAIWMEALSDDRISALAAGGPVIYDAIPPTLSSLSPTNGAPGWPWADDLVATFSENIATNAGSVTLTNLTDGTGVVMAMDNSQLTVSGNTLTINPTSDLDQGDTYAVLIDTNAIADTSGNLYAGITDTNGWRFTVAAQGAPTAGLGGGAIADTSSAVLRGALTGGGTANAIFCWGESDGGTNSISDWTFTNTFTAVSEGGVFSNAISSLWYGTEYDYRVYVTNDSGHGWSPLGSFVSSPPEVDVTVGISYHPITGDTDSEITNTTTYTHAVDFGSDTPSASINGVQFQEGGSTFGDIAGTSATIGSGTTTIITPHGGNSSAEPYLNGGLACEMEALVEDMYYGDSTGLITLTGLTPGTAYRLRLYNRGWGTSAGTGRGQDIGFDTDGVGSDIAGAEHTGYFEEDDASQPDPSLANWYQVYAYTYDYTLAAGVTELKVYVNQGAGESGTYHMYGLTNEEIPPTADIAVTNTAVSSVGATSADLSGTLNATGSVFDVYAYWSTTDNADGDAWLADGTASSALVGSYTNVVGQALSGTMSPLTPGTTYYCTLRAMNAGTNLWGSPNISFETVGAPTAGLGGGATDIGIGTATLRGEITDGASADATICWGMEDGGTSGTGAWENAVLVGSSISEGVVFSNAVSNILYGVEYDYRVYVVNGQGSDWSSVGNFAALLPTSGVAIANTSVAALGSTSATLQGTLDSTQSVFDVYAYWGTNDNADAAAWLADGDATTLLAGSYTNVMDQSVSAPVTGLLEGVTYYYTMMATNVSTNIWATPNASFTTLIIETDPPVLTGLNPTNGQINVLPDANLVATFDEEVFLVNGGKITITNMTDATSTTITLPNGQVSASGSNVTINPSSDLDFTDTYAVLIDNAAVEDIFNNVFTGITSDATWRFSMDTAPAIVSLSPTNNATGIKLTADFVATFTEDVALVNGGEITVSNLTDGTATAITLPDSQVTVSGTDLTIDLSAYLEMGDIYAVMIGAGAVEDLAGVDFAGISDTTTWRFTTTTDDNWSLTAYWPLDDGPIGTIANGATIQDVIDDPDGDEVDGTMQNNNASSSFVYDATRDRIVWRTPLDNRFQAGRTEMNRDFTWALWAKSDSGNGGTAMGTRNGQYTRFGLNILSGSYIGFDYPNNNDDTWHHMVLRRTGNLFEVFADGVLVASKTQAAGDNNMQLEIGGTDRYNEDFNGYMSDVAIWEESLTTNRIAELAAGGVVFLDVVDPSIASLAPTNNAVDQLSTVDFVATFDETVSNNVGNVVLSNLTDSTSVVIPIGDPQISISSSVLTINASSPLEGGDTYAVLIDAGAIVDTSGNGFAGISDTATWRVTIEEADAVPPVLSSVTPTNGSVLVQTDEDLVATFDENIQAGTGNVVISNLTDGTSQSIAIGDAQISIAGPVLTINPSANLAFGKTFAILIDSTAIADSFANDFAGIADTNTWRFTTDKPPAIVSLSPTNNATEINPGADLVVTFDEDIVADTGNVVISNLTAASATTIPIGDSQIGIAGAALTISLSGNLSPNSTYAVQIDTGAIDDVNGNTFPGINDTTTWRFSTTTNLNWSLVAYWPMTNATVGSIPAGGIIDDVIDDPAYPETDGVVNNSGGSWVDDAERGIVWHTAGNDRALAGSSQLGGDFTWSVWAKSIAANTGPLMGTRDGTYTRFYLTTVSGGYISFDFADFNDDTWHHFVFRRSGNLFSVYVDGNLEGSKTQAAAANTMKMELGGHTRYAKYFDGYMHQTAIWMEALTEDRIADLTAGATVIQDNTAPVITGLSPTNNATEIGVGANLVITFDDNIATNAGDIVVTNLTSGTAVAITVPGSDPDGVVSVSGNVLTINPTENLDPSKTYAILIGDGVIENVDGVSFAGIANDTTWQFTTGAGDIIAPTLATVAPANGATLVPVMSDLVAGFSENVVLADGGVITIRNLTDGTATTISIPDAQVSTSTTNLTINPSVDLDYGDLYAVQIDATAVEDTSANSFAGILDTTTWRFTTDTPPVISSLSPADGTTEVGTRDNLVITFNKNVALVPAGVITVKNLTEGTSETITLLDDRVTVAGGVVTINPRLNLDHADAYAVRISADAVEDLSGHNFAGIANDTTWDFHADTDPDANLVAYWMMNDGTNGQAVSETGIDDLVDYAGHPATDATPQGTGGVWVQDATRGIVWSTTDDDRAQAGNTPMNIDFTWAVWAKSAVDSGPLMGTRSGTYLRFNLNNLDGSYIGSIDYADQNDGAWHHMVFRRKGNLFSVFIDGSLSASKTSTAGDNNLTLELGGTGRYSEDFVGYLSDAAIWEEALSVTRIQQLAAGEAVRLTASPTIFLFK